MFSRTKGKYNSSYNLEEFFLWYAATASDPLPKKLFRSIFRGYMETIMADLIYNSSEFNMGHKLGSVRIREKDYEVQLKEDGSIDKFKLAPDWGKTLKKWKELYPDVDPSELKSIKNKPVVYIMNDHSDGTLKGWYWDKVTCNIKGQNIYKFNATRYWDRLLAKVNKESNVTYYK